MARRKRKTITHPSISRTIERIAIAALAAIATRGSGESSAVAAVTIFVILVAIEELDRRWVWDGKRVTLRDVALSSIGNLRLQRTRIIDRRRRERRSAEARRRTGEAALDKVDEKISKLQE